MDKIGSHIREVRVSQDISVRKLAEMTGISHSYISQIENNKRKKPKKYVIKTLCDALGIDYFDLMIEVGYFSKEEAQDRREVLKSSLESGKELDKTLQELEDDKRDILSILIGGYGTPLYDKRELSEQYIRFLIRLINDTISLDESELNRLEDMVKIMVNKDGDN